MKKLFNNKRTAYFIVFILGALSSFSLPPYNFFLINFFTLGFLFILLVRNKDLNRKNYFFYGWLFGFGYFLFSLYWISISLTFDKSLKILIPISIIIIPSFLSLFFAIPVYLLSFFQKFKNLTLILIFSLILGIFEFIRGHILTGFPWNLFIYSLSNNTSYIQMTSFLGTYGLNLTTITFFLIPAILFLKKTKFELILSFVLFSSFFLFFLIGELRINEQSRISKNQKNFQIKIISSNIDLKRFYDISKEDEIIDEMIKISDPEKEIPTLFIWPEGTLTSTYLKDIDKYKTSFKRFSKKHLILFGINDLNEDNNLKIYNSLVIVDNELNIKALYHKNDLVPFGEFLPIENILNKIGLRSITNNYMSFSEGDRRDIININNNDFKLSILPLICYEIIYSGKLSKNNNYDLIINISEDGWFGKSIGPHQHFVHSVFRAIEEGKSIIRSSNNGISAIIDPKGKILKINESTTSGVLSIYGFEKLSEMTVFSSYGRNNIFFYLVLIYITLIFFLKRQ